MPPNAHDADAAEPTPTPGPPIPPAPLPAPVPPIPPDHRDMYLLILGLVVGLALSPWIMGRFLNDVQFDHWYHGGGQALQAYTEFEKEHALKVRAQEDELLDRLIASGATQDAVEEKRQELQRTAIAERKPFTDDLKLARQAHEQWYRGFLFSLVVAATGLMFLEPLFDLPGPLASVRRRLVTARYAVFAVWIGFALAKPHMVQDVGWVFVILIVIVAIAAAILPRMLKAARTSPANAADTGAPEDQV